MVCMLKVVNILDLTSGLILSAAERTFAGVIPLTYAADTLSTMFSVKYLLMSQLSSVVNVLAKKARPQFALRLHFSPPNSVCKDGPMDTFKPVRSLLINL